MGQLTSPSPTQNPEGSQLRSPGLLRFSPPLLSQGVAPSWMCVASSVQQQPEETPRRRHLIANYHYRDEISELRNQGIYYRPLAWRADGRPHPAVTRTLQHAADIASGRNGQQMSAKSLQRRWKHEIQIALLRRRAAMTRTVLPNPSAQANSCSAGFTEREASAERSQIYHSDREGLMSSSSQSLNFISTGKLVAWLSHQSRRIFRRRATC